MHLCAAQIAPQASIRELAERMRGRVQARKQCVTHALRTRTLELLHHEFCTTLPAGYTCTGRDLPQGHVRVLLVLV